jgi:uncharacterized protein
VNEKVKIKKPNQLKTRKKLGLSRLSLIIIAIFIAAAFIIFSVYTPGKNITTAKKSSTNIKSIPTFKKDGILSINPAQIKSKINIDIEVADDEYERTRGLMDRISLPEFAGMLFIFEDDQQRSFWMKNTYISLDILFINSNNEIVSIQKYTQPQSTSSIPSEKPAKYVLEVNAGFTDKYSINPGDKIEIDI